MIEFGEFAGVRVGLTSPELLLAAVPVLIVIVALFLRGRSESTQGASKAAWFLSRVVITVLLVTAAAGPFTATAKTTPGDPRVTMLVDNSRSMVGESGTTEDLAAAIEAQGVPVTTQVVASDNRSRLGDAVVENARENGSLLVVSDGQVTGGQALSEAAEFARRLNTTVYAVPPSVSQSEGYIRLSGPQTTSVKTNNRYTVEVGGVNLEDNSHRVTVSVDGEEVNSTTVTGTGQIVVPHTFEEEGTHRVTARLDINDRYAANNVFRQTIQVVGQPDVLYVSRNQFPLADLLNQTYDVETTDRVPSRQELSQYLAVVTQNLPPRQMGNMSALQQYVIDGNGLVTVGGPDAYDNGEYEGSRLSVMLPVENGTQERKSRIMLVVDISGSAQAGLSTQKALAMNVINQLGDQNSVGIIAFNSQPYLIAEPRRLSGSRTELKTRIRRLQSGGRTQIASGLAGASRALGQGGSIVLLSDGRDRSTQAATVADQLNNQGTRVIAIGVGQDVNEGLLKTVGRRSGGTYFPADQTNRLRLLFGGESRQFDGGKLTIADSTHFITQGVTLTAQPGQTHGLAAKDGADLLVAGESGNPAVATWMFGLGRTASVTAYDREGTLGGLLSPPDSLLVTRTVNWVIGDPERQESGVTNIEPARVGRPTTVTFVGDQRPTPDGEGSRFVRTGSRTFEAELIPSKPGYSTVLGEEYGVNYPRELSGFGPSRGLGQLLRATGGTQFDASQADAIAEAVTQQFRRVRTVQEEWGWAFLAAALGLYLLEVVVRRLRRVGTGSLSFGVTGD